MIDKEERWKIIENFREKSGIGFSSPSETLILHKLGNNKYLVLDGNSMFSHTDYYAVGDVVNVKDNDVITTDFLEVEVYLVNYKKVLLSNRNNYFVE